MEWKNLSHAVQTILERVDINRSDVQLVIGQEIDIPYFKGIITEEIVKEIEEFQHSEDNEGFFSANVRGNILEIKFIKGAFD